MSLIYPGGDEQVTPNLGLATWGMDEVLAENMILIDTAFASTGTVVKINGVTEALANFNNTTPAAPGGATNVIWQVDGSGNVSAYITGGSSGTVTSVAMTGDGVIFNSVVSGSPITTAGTLAPSLISQVANRVLAGPVSGPSAAPTFRALVAGDIPSLSYVTSVALTMPAIFSVGGSPITSSGTLAVSLATETANTVWAGPTSGIAATPTFRGLVAADLPAGTGTVTSFSAGNLSPLFTTNVATPTTTPALTFALSNAGGGTVFGNNTTSAAAPAYTIAPVLGIPGTSSGSIALASATASGLYTIVVPANAATPTLTLPTASNVLAGQLAGDNTIFATTLVQASAAGTITLPTPKNQTANTVFAGPTSGGAAAPTFRALVAADIPSGAVLWNQIGSATGNLLLSNSTFTTEFDQTSSVAWTWKNTTPTIAPALTLSSVANASGGSTVYTGTITGGGANAYAGASVTIAGFTTGANNGTFVCTASTTTTLTLSNASGVAETHAATAISSAVTNSPILTLSTTYEGAANAPAVDSWTIQDITGSLVANPASALTFGHSGSTGSASVNFSGAVGTSTLAAITYGGIGAGWGLYKTSGSRLGFLANGTPIFSIIATPAIKIASGVTVAWSSTTDPDGTVDTGISRISAAVIGLGNGAAADFSGTLKLTTLNVQGLVSNYNAIATVSNGIPSELAVADLTAQSAAVAFTTLYTPTATGMFRVSFTATITTASDISSVLGGVIGLQLQYTSPTDSVVKQTVAGNTVTSAANTTGTALGGVLVIYAKTGTTIQYRYGYTDSHTTTAMQYELHVKLEAM